MKKILILSLLISCSQFFMSCENWFDVNPKSQVKNDILFENENGYKTALFGIYTTMPLRTLRPGADNEFAGCPGPILYNKRQLPQFLQCFDI